MLIGETIAAERLNDSANDTIIYTPWFARQGDEMSSTVEVIAIRALGKLTVDVYDKDSEATGSGSLVTVASGTNTFTGIAINTFIHDGLDEMVRYRVKLERTGAVDGTVFCHFRILSPSFTTTGAQSI